MQALGIDIGGTKIAGAIVGTDGTVAGRCSVATLADEGAPAILQAVIKLCHTLLERAHVLGTIVAAVGVGTAGHVDRRRGAITYASKTLPGWTGLALASVLQAELGLPVSVENDVNALAIGEAHFGAGRQFAEALYVAVGTGIGGAVVRDGRLWPGVSWTAGELGHLVVDCDGDRVCSCGHPGHLSAYVSGSALALQYTLQLGQPERCSLETITERARRGDLVAQQVITEGAQTLGQALGGLLNVLDPQALIVGGGLIEIGELWWRPFETALRANPMPGPAQIILRPAELGQNATLIGAAWTAMQSSNRLET